jgi:hypothetical protein
LLLEELDVLIVDKTLHVPLLPVPAWMTLRFSVTWEMQALYSEVSKPTSIGHSIRHKVQQLLPDSHSQLTILDIIAEGVIRP